MSVKSVVENFRQSLTSPKLSAQLVSIFQSVLGKRNTPPQWDKLEEDDLGNLCITISYKESVCIAGLVVVDLVKTQGSKQARLLFRGPKIIPISRIKNDLTYDGGTNE